MKSYLPLACKSSTLCSYFYSQPFFSVNDSFSGWRPRRTIKFCSWGAEEAALIGSTEWVEEHERALSTKGIAYINVDISVSGTHRLVLRGSPMFETAMTETVKNVDDPHLDDDGERMTVYERLQELFPKNDGEIPFESLGSGSDYAGFYQFVGENFSIQHFAF